MKAFLSAVVVIVAVAAAAGFGLELLDLSSASVYQTEYVRLDGAQ